METTTARNSKAGGSVTTKIILVQMAVVLFAMGGYSLVSCFISEVVMTFIFLIVIIGATDERAPKGLAPIAIGLCLTLIHLISIPVTATSVNPARSTGPALFAGAWALSQLWMFWVAPIIGAALAGGVYKALWRKD